MPWYRVASVRDVQPDAPFATTIGEFQLAIYRLGDEFFALEDVCPHAYALLSTGFIEDDWVECPLHGAKFHIPTGKCFGPPSDRDVKVLSLKIEAEDIFVEVLEETGNELWKP